MTKSNYKAIHFDMDGVIADTEAYHVAAEQQTCIDHGFDIDTSQWGGFKGRTAIDIFTYLVDTYGDPSIHKPKELINYKTDVFIESLKDNLNAIDGVLDFLKWARANHDHMSLVTSSNRKVQQFITDSLDITDLFDVIVTGDDITEGKPQPQPYLLAIEKLGITPDGSVVIEDSKSGILSAQRAGCDVLAIATSHSPEELLDSVPTYIVVTYIEAVEKLKEK